MWIFTRYGFYSIACASTPDGALDMENVMVRARLRDHLCGLQERFPDLASTDITTTQNAITAIGWSFPNVCGRASCTS